MHLPILAPDGAAADRRSPESLRRSSVGDVCWHGVRVLLLLALILGLHRIAEQRARRPQAAVEAAELLPHVQRSLPQAAGLNRLGESQADESQANAGQWLEVVDGQGSSLGGVATTSPEADSVVGYSGPNNVLLVLDGEQRVVGAELLRSGDTRDHVALVLRDASFWQQFVGRQWGEDSASWMRHVDGVSGATLTSLAIAEAVALRMSGQRLNLRFPTPPTLAEAQALAPQAEHLAEVQWHGQPAWQVTDGAGELLGTLVRTGNLVDAVEGYQGPTEVLLWFDTSGILQNLKLRSSYDNEPYVGYVRQEYSFWPIFKKRDVASLARIDLEAENIEGVSGATMTSLAVAQTIQAAAAKLQTQPAQPSGPTEARPRRAWNWSLTELATAGLALASLPFSRWRHRGKRLPRLVWQITCLLVLGLAAGNLLSLALLAGWTRGGVPLHLAPGLVTLLTVSLVWPVVSKSNVYCDQLCPHGILQQWMLPWRRRGQAARSQAARSQADSAGRVAAGAGQGYQPQLGRWVRGGLRFTSYLALAAAVGWLVWEWPLPLAALEPFDAYAWRVGWSASCAVWAASLLLAWWRPMAYCQWACPTGRALDVLRRARRRRSGWWLELGLAVAVACVWCLPVGVVAQ